jgi:hypothetical protein
MSENIIKFHSCHPSNNINNLYRPEPVQKHIPKWFLDKDKHAQNPDGTYKIDFFRNRETDAYEVHRIPSWKSCPAILDIFSSGYYLFTPCDITFKENLEIEYDDDWKSIGGSWAFCFPRGDEADMPTPYGYSTQTFAWHPNWFMEVPKGYTVLFTHPMNIHELPFRTMSGFIDASNILTGSGNASFYIQENWTGTIPAGTPYAQVIPIKNDAWVSEIVDHTNEEILDHRNTKSENYLIGPGITKYKQLDWLKKHYK